MKQNVFTLAELATLIGAKLEGDGDQTVTGIAPLETASATEISFLHNARYRKYLDSTVAAAVILSPTDANYCTRSRLTVSDPYLGFAKVVAAFAEVSQPPAGIHPTAIVSEDCEIDPTASIGPYCVIGKGVRIQKGVVLGSHCAVGDHVSIGENTYFYPHVTIYHDVKIGERTIIHSGVVIGSDGFGLARENNQWYKITHIGSVVIHNDVEVGSNTTIDRGVLANTIVEDGVKLDNQIQIGHNVHIGAHTAIAGCVAIAGSTKIGKYCMIGGGTCIGGHLTISDKTMITGMGMITNSIDEPGVYSSGTGFQKQRDWQKSAVRFRQFDQIVRRLKNLEENYAALSVLREKN
jgi:UDP-3-O-[3-hydroxymyristoyl] glucosamine N-acyltransferase